MPKPKKDGAQIDEESSLRIRVPAITLNKNDIRDLWKIVESAKDGSSSKEILLRVSGNKENVTTRSIDKLINARWPQEVDEVELLASCDDKEIRVVLEDHPMGTNRVEIYGRDPDWVSARAKEIDDFISEHKSWYWIFYSMPIAFTGSIALGALIGFGARVRLQLSFQNTLMAGAFGLMAIIFIWAYVIRPLYPFICVNTGSRSFKTRAKGIVNWVIATIIGGLLVNALSSLWTHH